MFKDSRHSDFTIICLNDKESKEIPVHRVILAARSPVFAAMLEPHTDEAKTRKVVYDDIEYEVMAELLFYVYRYVLLVIRVLIKNIQFLLF